MTTDDFVACLSTVRFPIRIRTKGGREYTVDRPAGVSVSPRFVSIVRDGFDIVLSVAAVDQVLDRHSSR
jgi:hypothetical protein